jgi:Ca2+-binding EF-hand superfamily protein
MVRYAPTLSRFDLLPGQVERAVYNVLEKEIFYQRKLESLKAMDGQDAWELISGGDQAINSLSVSNFLQNQDYEASETELMAIIRRMDENGDSTLTQKEFLNFLSPLQRDIPVRDL